MIDVQKGQLTLRVQDDQVSFNIFKALSFIDESSSYFRLDAMESCIKEIILKIYTNEPPIIVMVDVTKLQI